MPFEPDGSAIPDDDETQRKKREGYVTFWSFSKAGASLSEGCGIDSTQDWIEQKGKTANASVARLQVGNVMRGGILSGGFRILSEAGAESR